MLNGLDLFSGIGGLSDALAPWVQPIAYCENDRYAQAVLLSRMQRQDIPIAPIWDDVQSLHSCELLERPQIIYGGFPCQDISLAGAGAGLDGERSGLVFQFLRLIRECRPAFVFMENVPAITSRGLDRILLDLHSMGYDARWTIVSAAEMGACHIRERWFLLAHAAGPRLPRPDGKASFREAQLAKPARRNWWTSKPTVRGRNHGIPNRRDRIKAIGNSVVPIAAREAFKRLSGLADVPGM